jgi:DNA polymerase-3 subunit epsilon
MSAHIAPDAIHNVLDTETTGFQVGDDRLVEIGIVKMRGFDKVSEAHWLIDPDREIPEGATKVHGITNAKVKGCPHFEDIADAFLEFIGQDPLVIHNAGFDMRFLNKELEVAGRPTLRNKVVDTIEIARKKFPGSPVSLDKLASRFKIPNLRDGFHGALVDAQILSSVWIELEGGRQTGLFGSEKPKTAEFEGGAFQGQRQAIVIQASPEEIAAHAAFLKANVKNALWDRV